MDTDRHHCAALHWTRACQHEAALHSAAARPAQGGYWEGRQGRQHTCAAPSASGSRRPPPRLALLESIPHIGAAHTRGVDLTMSLRLLRPRAQEHGCSCARGRPLPARNAHRAPIRRWGPGHLPATTATLMVIRAIGPAPAVAPCAHAAARLAAPAGGWWGGSRAAGRATYTAPSAHLPCSPCHRLPSSPRTPRTPVARPSRVGRQMALAWQRACTCCDRVRRVAPPPRQRTLARS